jgi:hypothetical protein
MIKTTLCYILLLATVGSLTGCKGTDNTLPKNSSLRISVAQFVDSAYIFLPADQSDLVVSNVMLAGNGSAENPFRYKLTLKNPNHSKWNGILKVDLVSDKKEARFFLPGFMYGTNQGEVTINPNVRKQHPRLKKGDVNMPFSPYWLTRSDQLTHPVAIMHTNDYVYGISVSPYFTDKGNLWDPLSKDSLARFNGFGCSIVDHAEISFTLGYAYSPVLYETPYQYIGKTNPDEECITLDPGETLEIEYTIFAYESGKVHDVNTIIRSVYYKYHQRPRRSSSAYQMLKDITNSITQDAYNETEKTYALIWSFPEGLRYSYEGLIGWTNGTVIAYPLLMAAHRLQQPEYREQALVVIDNIVQNSMNIHSQLPNTVHHQDLWNNKGWWWNAHTASAGWEPDHSSYIVGQALYYILLAYDFEKKINGVVHSNWLEYVKTNLKTIQKTTNQDHAFPQFWSEKDGNGYFYDAFSGSWCVAAMALYTQVTEDAIFLQTAIESEKYYSKSVADMECIKTPLDVWDAADSEGILAYIRAVKILHQITGENQYLAKMKMGLDYELSFKFSYNVPIKLPPLGSLGFSTSGGTITSVGNAVIHCMSNSIIDEMNYYYTQTQDSYYKDRMIDTYLWGLQAYNSVENEFGFGKKGWSTEYFAQAERYVLDTKFPDGSWSNVWMAYHPWATAAIMEGICGDLWEIELSQDSASQ